MPLELLSVLVARGSGLALIGSLAVLTSPR